MTNDAAETAEGAANAEAVETSSDLRTLESESTQNTSEGDPNTIAADEAVQQADSDDAGAGDVLTDEPASDEPSADDADASNESATENAEAESDVEAEADVESDVHAHVEAEAGPDADADADADADVEGEAEAEAEMNELLGIASEPDGTAFDDGGADTPRDGSDSEGALDEAAREIPSHPEAHLLAPLVGAAARTRPAAVTETAEPVDPANAVLVARGLVKDFGGTHAVDEIDLTVPTGSFYGIVGPNGAGKTTTLSMISGLLRPDRGTITVAGIDARQKARAAKKLIGVLPDRFRTFDRLTGRQLLHYYGLLRGLKPGVVDKRTADLARAFDLTDALGRAVSDYSAGMTKKVMLAGAMIHSPRLLVLDEPFEAVDPVSAAVILEILSQYVAGGGTVILSSHTMELVERVCSRVAVVVAGQVLAEGTVDEVRGDLTLEQRFVELSGGLTEVEGLEWLHTFSD